MKYEIMRAQSLEEQKKADDERWRLQIAVATFPEQFVKPRSKWRLIWRRNR